MELDDSFCPLFVDGIKKGIYLINPIGQIYSIARNRMLFPRKDKDGYLQLKLRTDMNGDKVIKVHQLVMRQFNGNPVGLNDATIDHIDGNKYNNHYNNLRWLERADNSRVRMTNYNGERNPSARLTNQQAIEIYNSIVNKEMSYTQLAKKYGVKRSTIANIGRGKNWRNIIELHKRGKQ